MASKFENDNPEVTVTIDGRDYAVNMATGEILDWPAGEVRTMDRFLSMAHYADAAAKAWEVAASAMKAVIRRELEEADIRSVKGGAGNASLVGGNADRVPGGEAFVQWLRDVEFPPGSYVDLLMVAQEFNVKGFEMVCGMLGIDERTREKVITRRPYSYVRLSGAKPPPPAIRRDPEGTYE